MCECVGHDPLAEVWSGEWPGAAECRALGWWAVRDPDAGWRFLPEGLRAVTLPERQASEVAPSAALVCGRPVRGNIGSGESVLVVGQLVETAVQ